MTKKEMFRFFKSALEEETAKRLVDSDGVEYICLDDAISILKEAMSR